MKTRCLFVVFCILFICSRIAGAGTQGFEIVQEIEGLPGIADKQQVTIRTQGDLVRTDMDQISTVMNLATGDIATILHAQKMAMEIPGVATEAMREALIEKSAAGEQPVPRRTGRSERIGSFDCQEYEMQFDGQDFRIWTTTDVEVTAEIMRQLGNSQQNSPLAQAIAGRHEEISGFPIRVEMQDGNQTMRITTVSFREATFPASDFQIPEGYQKMAAPKEMGDLLQQLGGQ